MKYLYRNSFFIYISYILYTFLQNEEGDFLFMGEAFITRGGGSARGSSGSDSNFITEIFTSNTIWKVPENLKDGTVSVRLFGGGYAGDVYTQEGGSGGYMKNGTVNVSNETYIPITIGEGSKAVDKMNTPNTAGTSSFGTYLYALGASRYGGGSGGGGRSNYNSSSPGLPGYNFGGGGAASSFNMNGGSANGGNGGAFGGGGGAAYVEKNENTFANSNIRGGVGGIHGGNGGDRLNAAKNGTNTIGKGLEFEGKGICLSSVSFEPYINNTKIDCYDYYHIGYSGGGGYGGNGGAGSNCRQGAAGGGGGGYGANGGNGIVALSLSSHGQAAYAYGGGGGGYGGDGGDAGYYYNNNVVYVTSGGGGGGYGKFGKGGGYHNKVLQLDGGLAAGGYAAQVRNISNPNSTSFVAGNGGSGVCIIQYYIK